jgi:hypothetical protein
MFGGPGAGKSRGSSDIFVKLKDAGINAELAGEYAKDLTWGKRQHDLLDQLYVFGKQHHRVWILNQECEVVVCDSPILLGLAYSEQYPQCFKDTVFWAFNQYDNINFYVNRVKPYNPKGRNQDEEEAKEKDVVIKDLLIEYRVPFIEVNGDDEGRNTIVSEVLKSLFKKD